MYGKRAHWDELLSGATYLFIHCLKYWDGDPEKGKFSTYFYRAAHNNAGRHVITKVRYHKGTHHHDVSLDWSDTIDDSNDDFDEERRSWSVSDECTETQALDSIMGAKLHDAIQRLPGELREHAKLTLEGRVDWKDLKHTARLRREMLKALRKEMKC